MPRHLALLAAASLLAGSWLPAPATAGPLRRRLEERQACQTFAGQLRQASGNPQQAQQVYQQGVLKLVETFGNNPCTDIPAPAAAQPSAAPGGQPNPTPAATPATAPATPAAAAAPAAASPTNPQQAKACADFAAKLQAAQASGDRAQAQRVYQMGSEKTAAAFGAHACPNVKAP